MTDDIYMREVHERPASWTEQAACHGHDEPDAWFPATNSPKDQALLTARLVCATCPVSLECFDDALRRAEKVGVWGGVNFGAKMPAGRVRIQRLKKSRDTFRRNPPKPRPAAVAAPVVIAPSSAPTPGAAGPKPSGLGYEIATELTAGGSHSVEIRLTRRQCHTAQTGGGRHLERLGYGHLRISALRVSDFDDDGVASWAFLLANREAA